MAHHIGEDIPLNAPKPKPKEKEKSEVDITWAAKNMPMKDVGPWFYSSNDSSFDNNLMPEFGGSAWAW